MYQVQKQKGITLIALVITVIVLIILAGVAINLTVGENGLLTKAKQAKTDYNLAKEKEELELEITNIQIEIASEENREATLNDLYARIDKNKYTIELSFDPVAATENVNTTPTYSVVNKIGSMYYFTVDSKLVITDVETREPKVSYITFSDITWNEGKASITLSTKAEGTIEYKVGEDGVYTSGTTISNLSHGDTVYARINNNGEYTEEETKVIYDGTAPEEFEVTTSDLTYNSVKLTTTGTTDNQTGLASYTYVAENNGNIVQEIPDQTVTEYPITGLEEQTEYVVYMLAYDNAGNVRKSNEVTVKTTAIPIKNMIGKPVNYSANGITDWKVFYGYDDGEIYLIKSDYLNKSKIPSAAMMTEGLYQRAYWPTSVTYDNIIDTDTSIRTRFLMSFNANKTNLNIMAVSKLLNTTTWSAFANGTSGATQITGGFAIGSPTYEMWVASWNEVYPTQKITVQKDNVGFVVPNTPSGVKNDVLYNTSNTEQVNALNGYFLASPSVTLNSGYIYRGVLTYDWRSSGKITKEDATNCAHTARPVVSIPSTYKLKWNSETNMYDIVEK